METKIILLCALAVTTTLAFDRKEAQKVLDNEEGGRYTTADHSKQVVCYWGTWSNYRPSEGKFTPEDVDASLCTNLIYSFAGLDKDKYVIKSLDKWMDLADDYGLDGFGKATSLKYAYPNLKVTIAIGGWNEGSESYSQMAMDPQKRATFVASVLDFLTRHNFDGLDLDWEYPAKRGGKPEDKQNFVALIRDLRQAFDASGKGYLLTAAIGSGVDTIDRAYDVPALYKYLDYIHIMSYDYHGKWEKKTGHNAPLYSHPKEKGGDLFLNVNSTWHFLMEKGARPEKTVLGMPFYGRAFHLANPHDARIGARSRDTSFSGPYTREDGFLGYNEICEEQQQHQGSEKAWKVKWSESHAAPYMYKDIKWISYDDRLSIAIKTKYAVHNGLAGVMTWSIDTDDFRGVCGFGRYPLLHTMNRVLSLAKEGRSEVFNDRAHTGAIAGITPGSASPRAESGADPISPVVWPTMVAIIVAVTSPLF